VKFKFPDEWPWLGVLDENGATKLAFPGVRGPAEFVPRLEQARALVGTPLLDWDQTNDLVARLIAAKQNEEQSWIDDAYDEYVVIREKAPDGPLRVRADNGLRRIAARARAAVLGARDLATNEEGVRAAIEALETEIEAFRDTPYEADLRAVRDRLETTGEFPEVRAKD
jgi:hypothetical protein